MKVAIVGGTGMIGRALSAFLEINGLDVVVFSRDPKRRTPRGIRARVVGWSELDVPGLAANLDGVDAVVNLAGARVGPRRWTTARKRVLRDSRIGPTRAIVDAIGRLPADRRPRTLVNASGTDGYTGQDDVAATEAAQLGGGFLADVCREWEAEAARVEEVGVRVVCLRIGPVFAHDATVLKLLSLPVRLGFGGRLGTGNQWISWIHIDDLLGVIAMALRDDRLSGVVNVVAPQPVKQIDLTRALGRHLHRPIWLRLPGWLLRVALGEGVDVVLGSRRVAPARLAEAGFEFRYPTLDAALDAALR